MDARQMTYRFLSLPYHMRIRIARDLDLVRGEDEGLHGIELFKRFFRRAREERIIGKLQVAIDRKFEENRNEFLYG